MTNELKQNDVWQKENTERKEKRIGYSVRKNNRVNQNKKEIEGEKKATVEKKRPTTNTKSKTVAVKKNTVKHLAFMGYPITGDVKVFADKLIKEKGCRYDPDYDNCATIHLKGDFWRFNNSEIILEDKDGKINTVKVFPDRYPTKDNVKDLLERYVQKYGMYKTNASHEKYFWDMPSGKVTINDDQWVFAIIFEDYTTLTISREIQSMQDADL